MNKLYIISLCIPIIISCSLSAMEEEHIRGKQDLPSIIELVTSAWKNLLYGQRNGVHSYAWIHSYTIEKKGNKSFFIELGADKDKSCTCTISCNNKKIAFQRNLGSKEETLEFINKTLHQND